MSDGVNTNADDRLVEVIRAALHELDGPPPEVVALAKQSLTWRNIDAELAALTYDSAVDGDLVGVRGTGTARALTFEVGAVVIDLEVSDRDTARDVLGQVAPAGDVALSLVRPTGNVDVALDDLGRFRLTGLASGPARFVLVGPSGTVGTDWITL
jgi:hypothetical protein